MANDCLGYVTVRGYKDNVDEFTRIIQADYDYNKMEFSHKPHLFRVFEAQIYYEELNGLQKTVSYSIDCAWSIYSCMLKGDHTYYNDLKERFKEFYGTHLQQEAKRLNLWIEAQGSEPALGFQEYYLINNFGMVIEDHCVDYHEVCPDWYDLLDEFNDDLKGFGSDMQYTEQEFKNKKYDIISIGGVDKSEVISIDKLIDMANIVMVKTVNKK